MTSQLRRLRVTLAAIILLSLILSGIPAQEVPGPVLSDMPDIPAEYEDTIRDIVERYEEVRTLLREQIRRNTELYTQEEIDDALADLNQDVERLEGENDSLRRQYKRLLIAEKNARTETEHFKGNLVKTRSDLEGEIQTLERVIDSIEEETLLQVGPTFSPSGRIGGVGIFNLPGTNVSLMTAGDYNLREKAFTTSFGVAFGFFPQGSIVEGFERLRSRIRSDAPSSPSSNDTQSAAE